MKDEFMSEPTVILSKSKILSYLQCPKLLWLETFQPEDALLDEGAQARKKAGTQAGKVASGLFPGGQLIKGQSMVEKMRLTQKALGSLPRPLYEATFMHENVQVMVDILLPEVEGWRIIEVKSSTPDKKVGVVPRHIADTAIQVWVLQGCGLDLCGQEVALIDNSFVYPGGGDYARLFTRHDVKEKVQELLPSVPAWIAGAAAVLSNPGDEPACSPGKQCKKPSPCPFRQYCSPVREGFFPVETLPRIKAPKMKSLRDQGYADIRDIPDSVKLSSQQSLVRKAVKMGRLVLSENVASKIEALAYPRFYLDFETIQFAVPVWPGTRPYEQIPFQWSCHIEDAPGRKPRHYEFLAKHNSNPRYDFAETLAACIATEEPGPVIVYNAAFEKTILKETAKAVPEFAEQLSAIHDRVFDLLPVAQNHYCHPAMRGSWSIKSVSPTVAPDLDYDSLEVQHGGMAQTAFLAMIDLEQDSPEQETLYKALLEYCELDTFAMWRLARFFAGDRAELGRLYLYGGYESIKDDKTLGFELLSSAKDLGYGDDKVIADLIKCYLFGWGTERNIWMANQLIELFHDEIKEEDPQAMYLLGLVSHESSSDPESGLEWMRKAAAKGHKEAMEFLKERNV
jgi:hypothetical protein